VRGLTTRLHNNRIVAAKVLIVAAKSVIAPFPLGEACKNVRQKHADYVLFKMIVLSGESFLLKAKRTVLKQYFSATKWRKLQKYIIQKCHIPCKFLLTSYFREGKT
jgi:hypothetical protein